MGTHVCHGGRFPNPECYSLHDGNESAASEDTGSSLGLDPPLNLAQVDATLSDVFQWPKRRFSLTPVGEVVVVNTIALLSRPCLSPQPLFVPMPQMACVVRGVRSFSQRYGQRRR